MWVPSLDPGCAKTVTFTPRLLRALTIDVSASRMRDRKGDSSQPCHTALACVSSTTIGVSSCKMQGVLNHSQYLWCTRIISQPVCLMVLDSSPAAPKIGSHLLCRTSFRRSSPLADSYTAKTCGHGQTCVRAINFYFHLIDVGVKQRSELTNASHVTLSTEADDTRRTGHG